MGFLDFLKKNQPAPPLDPAPVAPPQEPGFGSAMLDDHPAAPDAYLSDLAEHHDPADDLFSPLPSGPARTEPVATPEPQASAPLPSSRPSIPDELFAPPKRQQPASTPAPIPAPVPVIAPKPASPVAGIPDFTEEDIAALERLQHATTVSVIGMDTPSIMSAPPVSAPEAATPPAPQPLPEPIPATREPAPVTVTTRPTATHDLPDLPGASPFPTAQEDASGFLSAEGYLGITDDVRASRRGLRRCDDAIRDALTQHEELDLQYARAAADIASIEERLRSLDTALFGE